MDDFDMDLKTLREEKGLSQQDVANKLFVTRQAVARWESGQTQPDIETLKKLAQIYGVSVERLITGKDAPVEKVEVPVEKIVEIDNMDSDEAFRYNLQKMIHSHDVMRVCLGAVFAVLGVCASVFLFIKGSKVGGSLFAAFSALFCILTIYFVIRIANYKDDRSYDDGRWKFYTRWVSGKSKKADKRKNADSDDDGQ